MFDSYRKKKHRLKFFGHLSISTSMFNDLTIQPIKVLNNILRSILK